MEIERKFLLASEPPGLFKARRSEIRQGYLLSTSRREIRIRARDKEFSLTVKDGSGLVRGETETAIPAAQFEALWPLTEGARVEKARYVLPWNNLKLEVDVYAGSLAPLRVVEIEFINRIQSEAFIKPPFLGLEVTGRGEYSNAQLATMGAPSRSDGQIGCVPFLFKGKELHIVLVRSSSGLKWIVPKGQSENGMTHAEVALMEAAEEGGVIGTIEPSLHSPCVLIDGREIRLYALRVATLLKRWPEDNLRKRTTLPWKDAVANIDDKALAACVEDLARRFLEAF